MNIDWSKAPEGTEAAHPGSSNILPAWFKRDAAGLVEQICPGAGINGWAWMGGRREFPHGHVLRPSADKQAWTGEGLPPVGAVCEFMKHNSPPAPEGQWTVGDIRYVSDCYVIIGGEGCEHAHHPRNCSFRPVRTPEQIAAEDRQKELDSLTHELYRDIGMEPRDAERLFNKGYRKQVQP